MSNATYNCCFCNFELTQFLDDAASLVLVAVVVSALCYLKIALNFAKGLARPQSKSPKTANPLGIPLRAAAASAAAIVKLINFHATKKIGLFFFLNFHFRLRTHATQVDF